MTSSPNLWIYLKRDLGDKLRIYSIYAILEPGLIAGLHKISINPLIGTVKEPHIMHEHYPAECYILAGSLKKFIIKDGESLLTIDCHPKSSVNIENPTLKVGIIPNETCYIASLNRMPMSDAITFFCENKLQIEEKDDKSKELLLDECRRLMYYQENIGV